MIHSLERNEFLAQEKEEEKPHNGRVSLLVQVLHQTHYMAYTMAFF